MKAVQQLRRLTTEQRALLRSRNLKLHRSPDDLLALLEPLAVLDSSAKAERAKFRVRLVLCLAAAAGLLFLSLKSDGCIRIGGWIGSGGFAGVALFLWLFLVRPISAARTEISANLREVALPFLRILREEVETGKLLQIQLSLNPLEQRRYKVEGSTAEETTYLDRWFEGQATLAEGTRLHWRVVDRLRVRTRMKRSSSGKMRIKKKRMLRSDVAVKLAFPSRLYSVPATAGNSTGAGSENKRLPVTLRKASKTEGSTTAALGVLLDLIADGYRGAAPRKDAP